MKEEFKILALQRTYNAKVLQRQKYKRSVKPTEKSPVERFTDVDSLREAYDEALSEMQEAIKKDYLKKINAALTNQGEQWRC